MELFHLSTTAYRMRTLLTDLQERKQSTGHAMVAMKIACMIPTFKFISLLIMIVAWQKDWKN